MCRNFYTGNNLLHKFFSVRFGQATSEDWHQRLRDILRSSSSLFQQLSALHIWPLWLCPVQNNRSFCLMHIASEDFYLLVQILTGNAVAGMWFGTNAPTHVIISYDSSCTGSSPLSVTACRIMFLWVKQCED